MAGRLAGELLQAPGQATLIDPHGWLQYAGLPFSAISLPFHFSESLRKAQTNFLISNDFATTTKVTKTTHLISFGSLLHFKQKQLSPKHLSAGVTQTEANALVLCSARLRKRGTI